jgi:phosphate transport system substrate-binding protein
MINTVSRIKNLEGEMMIFRKGKKLLAVVGTLMIGAMVVAGCGADKPANSGSAALEGKITASGSTALLPLLKPAQEDFQNKNAKVTVNVFTPMVAVR